MCWWMVFADSTPPLPSCVHQVHDDIMSEAQQLVKMTPVLAERAERGQTISRDEEVEGYLDHPTVFTDISQGVEAKVRVGDGERERGGRERGRERWGE